MLGSSLLGFCAALPGKKVPVGAVWTLVGNLLDIHRCDNLLASFTFEGVEEFEGERCARITGRMTGWPFEKPPEFSCELRFSLERRMPVLSTLHFKSSSREERITVRARGEAAKEREEGK